MRNVDHKNMDQQKADCHSPSSKLGSLHVHEHIASLSPWNYIFIVRTLSPSRL